MIPSFSNYFLPFFFQVRKDLTLLAASLATAIISLIWSTFSWIFSTLSFFCLFEVNTLFIDSTKPGRVDWS